MFTKISDGNKALADVATLEKAGHSIGNFFAKQVQELEKSHALHAALAAHHQGKADAHTAHAVHYKAQHDALPDGHEMKAHMAKGHSHHTTMAAHEDGIAKAHGAHAETMKTDIDAMKALSSTWGGVATAKAAGGGPATAALATVPFTPSGNVMLDMVQETSAALMKKTLETMDTDPEVRQAMREHVMKLLGEAVGNMVVPTGVSAVTPGVRAVPRAGQQPVNKAPEKPNVPLEFQKLFTVEDDEERPVLQR